MVTFRHCCTKPKDGDVCDPSALPRHDPDLSDDDSDGDGDEVAELPPPPKLAQRQRQSVSAEAFGAWNKKKPFVAPVYPKTEAQKKKIQDTIQNSFLFSSLDAKDVGIVIDAFKEVKVQSGTVVIEQDADGDCLYLIESGKFKCTKKLASGETKFLTTLGDGDVVGELALLYNCPRAATVTAEEGGILWVLDRESFNHIVKDAASEKRELHQELLREVEILTEMDDYERSKLADAFKTGIYKKGEEIVRQGESGDTFFIIEDGEAEAFKDNKSVMLYKRGDYFGELALIKNQPRAASVVAKTPLVTCICLERRSFSRMLGPVEDILKRNMSRYNAVMPRVE